MAVIVQENRVSRGTELLLKHIEEKEGKEGLIEYINTIHFNSGCTVLYLAYLVQNYHIVKVLLEHGVDYKTRDKKGLESDDFAIGNSHLSRQIRYLFGSYRQSDLATGHNK